MNLFEPIKAKQLSKNQLVDSCRLWQSQGLKIVFTNGCFDLLHPGHVDYLAKAAALGNKLVVGVNTDASVSRLKGPLRPIQNELARCFVLSGLASVDAVCLFDENTPFDLIQAVQPDVLVKGSDYAIEQIVGYDIVTARGGKVCTIDFVPGFSTSAIEEKIRQAKA